MLFGGSQCCKPTGWLGDYWTFPFLLKSLGTVMFGTSENETCSASGKLGQVPMTTLIKGLVNLSPPSRPINAIIPLSVIQSHIPWERYSLLALPRAKNIFHRVSIFTWLPTEKKNYSRILEYLIWPPTHTITTSSVEYGFPLLSLRNSRWNLYITQSLMAGTLT